MHEYLHKYFENNEKKLEKNVSIRNMRALSNVSPPPPPAGGTGGSSSGSGHGARQSAIIGLRGGAVESSN